MYTYPYIYTDVFAKLLIEIKYLSVVKYRCVRQFLYCPVKPNDQFEWYRFNECFCVTFCPCKLYSHDYSNSLTNGLQHFTRSYVPYSLFLLSRPLRFFE